MMVLVLMGTGVALFALVVANILLGQVGIVRSQLDQRVTLKQHTVETLTVDVARLSSPERIGARAAELGLVPAEKVYPLSTIAPSPVRGPSPSRGRP